MRLAVLAAIAGFALTGAAFAHPATEQFIPIGQSPGGGTVQGTAGAVAAPASGDGPAVVQVVTPAAAAQDFVIGPETRIYIDRSAQGAPNVVGTIEDVQPGRVIEVRLADETTRVAAWIKVRPN